MTCFGWASRRHLACVLNADQGRRRAGWSAPTQWDPSQPAPSAWASPKRATRARGIAAKTATPAPATWPLAARRSATRPRPRADICAAAQSTLPRRLSRPASDHAGRHGSSAPAFVTPPGVQPAKQIPPPAQPGLPDSIYWPPAGKTGANSGPMPPADPSHPLFLGRRLGRTAESGDPAGPRPRAKPTRGP